MTRAGIALLLAGSSVAAYGAGESKLPDAIQVPAGQNLVLEAHARGFQVYACGKSENGHAQWTLKAPDAVLLDSKGQTIGHHFAGPTWKHTDGSEVVGTLVSRTDAPDRRSIAWLLLSAASHSGQGAFSKITSIQRIHTKGGQAPGGESCGTTNLGAETRVRYSADYLFYAPAQ